MNQKELRSHLERLVASLERESQELLQVRLESLASVFPFNEYEYMITFLVDHDVIFFPRI